MLAVFQAIPKLKKERMSPVIKNILAVIAGIAVGGFVNSAIIGISGSVIPPPEGVDPSDMESLKANMHLFEARHFIMPFLAHAVGTLVGAAIAAAIAATNKMKIALGIGAFFLLGGIAAVFLLPSPTWFIVVDLIGAYFPMAWLGGKLTAGKAKSKFV